MKKESLKAYLEKIEPFLKRYRLLLLAFFAGLILLTISFPVQSAAEETDSQPAVTQSTFDLTAFETQLEEQLSQIQGAGRVQLTLSLKTTQEEVYAADIRQSQQNEEVSSYESTLAVLADGINGQQPIPVKQVYPTFRGALVLCDGADSDAVRLAVTQAVSAVCGIGADKVAVLKMQ